MQDRLAATRAADAADAKDAIRVIKHAVGLAVFEQLVTHRAECATIAAYGRDYGEELSPVVAEGAYDAVRQFTTAAFSGALEDTVTVLAEIDALEEFITPADEGEL